MAKIKKIETSIDGMVVIDPKVLLDERGYFMESYNKEEFAQIGIRADFVQDNESKSKKGVLRGLHFQTKFPQGKLVRVLQGSVFDVGVDLRAGSPTYGQWEGVILSEQNKRMFYVPEGCAHGFLVVSDFAVFTYKCTNFYHPEYDSGIIYNDTDIAVKWPTEGIEEIILSDKDKHLKNLRECKAEF